MSIEVIVMMWCTMMLVGAIIIAWGLQAGLTRIASSTEWSMRLIAASIVDASAVQAHDAVKLAADKYMESMKLDTVALANRQTQQEATHWRSVATLLQQLRLAPIYEMGALSGFRKLKPKEKYPDLLEGWYRTTAETF